ncbi:hypothetical protein [Bradyrhizobium arachidis]|uniref:hypothetical protein n=1 Tax=Bradyrhizobium arachidis TaxID=858423 RepID=UPI002163C5D5|nr:hypothetical protein [Bradyrhizobium arachidis]UVO27588.1 hypothetical protein KUF59_34685 [Bradyrhizobium arachidis]
MTKADQPSEHLRLAAELAVGLARRLSMTLEPDDPPDYYWHYAQTPFEDGCDVLWELGVALALVTTATGYQGMTRQQYVDAKRRPGEETFAVYKFFPAPETRARVLACGEISDVLFKRLLEAYVDTACEYGPAGTQLFSGLNRSSRRPNLIARLPRSSRADMPNVAVTWSNGPPRLLQRSGQSLVRLIQVQRSHCHSMFLSVWRASYMTATPSQPLPLSGRKQVPTSICARRM